MQRRERERERGAPEYWEKRNASKLSDIYMAMAVRSAAATPA